MNPKRSLTPTVTTLEPRLALSTTTPTIVQPPTVTGVITTLQPTVQPIQSSVLSAGGTLEYLAAVEAPIIVAFQSGDGTTSHFLTIVTPEPFTAGSKIYMSTAAPLQWAPTSQLT